MERILFMKKWLIEDFGFSKREYNGLLYLLILAVLITLAPYVYAYYINSQDYDRKYEDLALQKLILIDRYEKKKYANARYPNKNYGSSKIVSYHTFDPNLIDENEWQGFGLSYKQAMSIVNYVKKGGKFYKPEDLKRMYTISPEKYEALLPFVAITPSVSNFEKKPGFAYVKREAVVVEINAADTLELDKIKGIGLSFARRIVKYRERLGGFHSKEQLFEVFGVDTAKFNEIKDQIKIDINFIKKMNINTAEFEDLKKHPYLRYKEMNAIIQYRKQHGAYKTIADLNKVLILTPQTIQKIAPYLSLENDSRKD